MKRSRLFEWASDLTPYELKQLAVLEECSRQLTFQTTSSREPSVFAVTQLDIRRFARTVLRDAGMFKKAFRVQDLVRFHLGQDGIRLVPARALPSEGALASIDGQPRIYLQEGLSGVMNAIVVAHELGHWALQLDSSSQENERACDAFAMFILTRREELFNAESASEAAE